jgi:hypothetical protein
VLFIDLGQDAAAVADEEHADSPAQIHKDPSDGEELQNAPHSRSDSSHAETVAIHSPLREPKLRGMDDDVDEGTHQHLHATPSGSAEQHGDSGVEGYPADSDQRVVQIGSVDEAADDELETNLQPSRAKVI